MILLKNNADSNFKNKIKLLNSKDMTNSGVS